MKQADRNLVKKLRAVIAESAPTDPGAGQVDLVIPDSPYSSRPIATDIVFEAARGIPNVYAVRRVVASTAVPFDGWCVTFRPGATA